jgi:ubiquinone/menaquinone biosynthesis C-methylase UbiE
MNRRRKTRSAIEEHFDQVADAYTELRGDPDYVEAVAAALARAVPLTGRRLLDLGCGSGTLLRAFAERHAAQGVGVDSSSAMIELARRQLPAGTSAYVANAEQLPFAACSFDAVVASMSVHHFDRGRAFAEVLRVLAPGGGFAISTTDPDSHSFWAARFFPSYRALERELFPSEAELRADLLASAFSDVNCERLELERAYERRIALAKLHSRAYSTFALMDPEEYEAGLRRARKELENVVRSTVTLMIFSAKRPE